MRKSYTADLGGGGGGLGQNTGTTDLVFLFFGKKSGIKLKYFFFFWSELFSWSVG